MKVSQRVGLLLLALSLSACGGAQTLGLGAPPAHADALTATSRNGVGALPGYSPVPTSTPPTTRTPATPRLRP